MPDVTCSYIAACSAILVSQTKTSWWVGAQPPFSAGLPRVVYQNQTKLAHQKVTQIALIESLRKVVEAYILRLHRNAASTVYAARQQCRLLSDQWYLSNSSSSLIKAVRQLCPTLHPARCIADSSKEAATRHHLYLSWFPASVLKPPQILTFNSLTDSLLGIGAFDLRPDSHAHPHNYCMISEPSGRGTSMQEPKQGFV